LVRRGLDAPLAWIFPLRQGALQEVVVVETAGAQVDCDSHALSGVIQRQTIQDLPLNCRIH